MAVSFPNHGSLIPRLIVVSNNKGGDGQDMTSILFCTRSAFLIGCIEKLLDKSYK